MLIGDLISLMQNTRKQCGDMNGIHDRGFRFTAFFNDVA